MSVFDPEVTQEEFRGHWGIPFGRPGGAVDYAQCIFGLITVSLIVPVGSQVMFRTNMSPALNLWLTVDGCWKRVSGNEMSDNVIMVDKQNSKISIKQNDKPCTACEYVCVQLRSLDHSQFRNHEAGAMSCIVWQVAPEH